MHSLCFSIKRAFHCSNYKILPEALKRAGSELTPARFDLLDLIGRHKGGVAQCRLHLLLGVRPATTSRMLKSVQLLGLVVRRRLYRDKRYYCVELTEEGKRCVDEVLRSQVDSGSVDQGLRVAMGVQHLYPSAAAHLGPNALRAARKSVRKPRLPRHVVEAAYQAEWKQANGAYPVPYRRRDPNAPKRHRKVRFEAMLLRFRYAEGCTAIPQWPWDPALFFEPARKAGARGGPFDVRLSTREDDDLLPEWHDH